MWWLLHVPFIFANGVYGFKKNLVSRLKYPKARFQKAWSWRKKNEQRFLLRFQSCLQKKVSALAIWCMRGVRGGRLSRTRFSTMVWSPSCYPNTNKQRRNIGVNDRGGGWRRVGGRAERSRAPEPWKVKDRCVTHTSSPSSGRDSHAAAVSPPNFFASFHNFSQLIRSLQRFETSQLTAWLHESFMDLELGKLLAALYWSSSPL